MYLEMARYNAFTWWTRFPSFLLQAARVDRPTILGGDPGEARAFLERRPHWLQPAYRWCLDHYGACIPYLFVLGLAVGVLRNQSSLAALLLTTYFLYYAAALFLVLPLSKHFLQLLLPLHVLSAVGLWFVLRSIRSGPRLRELKERGRRTLPVALLTLATLLVGWTLLAFAAYSVSRDQRRRFIDSIRSVAATGQDAPETLKAKKLFSVSTPAEGPSVPVGYLLKVRGASQSVELLCAHVRERTSKSDPLAYYTRHRIQPDREQFFFFNIVSGTNIGDDRPYTAFVRVRGKAELLSSTRVDLSAWSLGLPLGFVFDENDDQVGSPFIAPYLPTEETYATLPEIEAALRPRE